MRIDHIIHGITIFFFPLGDILLPTDIDYNLQKTVHLHFQLTHYRWQIIQGAPQNVFFGKRPITKRRFIA
jgi:hypothetical protein